MRNLHALTLARAALVVGSEDALARELAIPRDILARYMHEDLDVPMDVFLRASEIVTDSTVEDAKASSPNQESRG